MATTKRSYLPRSTMDYTAIRGVYEYAEEHKVPFGKALETLLLNSQEFNKTLSKLTSGSEWFKEDVEEFKNSCSVFEEK